MSGTWRVLLAEVYRTRRGRATLLGAGFLLVIPALRVLASRAAAAAARAEAIASGRDPSGMLGADNAWAPFVDGWRAGLILGTLLLLIHSARALAADREAGVLRLASTRSATRSDLVIGRALMAPLLVVGVVAVSGAGAWMASAALYEFGPLVEDGYELMSHEELVTELRLAVLAAIPPLLATYAFGLCVSAAARTAVGAVSGALALFLAFDLFKEVLGAGQHWVFASFAPSFVDGSAMHEMAGMARGYADSGYPEALLNMNLWLPWPEALVLVALACWILSRRAL